jgi:hypothetical protein
MEQFLKAGSYHPALNRELPVGIVFEYLQFFNTANSDMLQGTVSTMRAPRNMLLA